MIAIKGYSKKNI